MTIRVARLGATAATIALLLCALLLTRLAEIAGGAGRGRGTTTVVLVVVATLLPVMIVVLTAPDSDDGACIVM